MKEVKSLAWLEAKADAETGRFSGYGSTYNVDLYGDKILPGAFGQTIKDRKGKVPLLMNHWTDNWAGTSIELAEDGKGLFVEGKLFLNTTAGRDVHGLLKDAADADTRVGLSIGYIATDFGWEEDLRVIKAIDLWEISFTPFPANLKAFVTDAKTVRFFEKALRDVGRFSQSETKKIISVAAGCNLFSNGTLEDADKFSRLLAVIKKEKFA